MLQTNKGTSAASTHELMWLTLELTKLCVWSTSVLPQLKPTPTTKCTSMGTDKNPPVKQNRSWIKNIFLQPAIGWWRWGQPEPCETSYSHFAQWAAEHRSRNTAYIPTCNTREQVVDLKRTTFPVVPVSIHSVDVDTLDNYRRFG